MKVAASQQEVIYLPVFPPYVMILLLVDRGVFFVRKEDVALESFQAAIKHLSTC